MENIQEDNWGGGWQSASDSHKEVQAGLKGDFMRERAATLKLIVQVIRGEITKQKFKKLTGYGFDEMRNSSYYRNQIKRMSKKALAPVVPTTPTMKDSYESDGEEIQEKVDIDGRTRSFKNTVMRLEQLRQTRSNKTDNYKGLYDDGSGRGASLPNPISFNKESRSTMGIDGRANALKEALKRVESYRKMREATKKKTLLGMKESDENMHEGTSLTRGQILDAVGMTNNKFEVTEEELSSKQKEYRAFFQKALKKHDAKSPADLDDAGKKKFFDYVKANWKG